MPGALRRGLALGGLNLWVLRSKRPGDTRAGVPGPSLTPLTRPQAPGSAQVAGLCRHLTLHRDLRTGRWEPDPQRSRRCLRDPQRVLEYCRQVGGPCWRGVVSEPGPPKEASGAKGKVRGG